MLLTEIRSNPEQNIKKLPLEQLKEIRNTFPNDHLFVTFTVVKKFGINIKSQYVTPLGIYCYPIDYVIDQKMNVPYGKGSPHIWVFKTNDFWNLQHTFNENVQKNIIIAMEKMGLDTSDVEFANTNNKLYKSVIKTAQKMQKNPNVLLHTIFKKASINGIVDNGEGIIFKTEPTQGVFFNTPSLEVVSYIPNKISILQNKNLEKSNETITFDQYYDFIVYGNNTRDSKIESSVVFKKTPTEYQLLKMITKSVIQRKGRLTFLEKYIAQNSHAAVAYARDVLGKRFMRGEPVIKKDPVMWNMYNNLFPDTKYGG